MVGEGGSSGVRRGAQNLTAVKSPSDTATRAVRLIHVQVGNLRPSLLSGNLEPRAESAVFLKDTCGRVM